ncbi:MAG: XdhC family protein [Sphingomonadales bacterium]
MTKHTAYDTQDPLETALQWADEGHGVALATVIETWGSAPRPAGSMLCIRDDGLFAGSVSGGCVEGDVIAAAEDSIKEKQVQKLSYGVSNTMAWEVGLACGGKISVLVEPLNKELVQKAQSLRSDKIPFAMLLSEQKGLVDCCKSKNNLPNEVGDIFDKALRDDKLQSFDLEEDRVALIPFNPPLRLIIIGAVHISQALAPLAAITGYGVTIIDPRQTFARTERFQNQTIIEDWPDDALKDLGIDSRTAIVTLTHDPKLDDPALHIALKSKCFYIGCLGSKKTHAARLERLTNNGFSPTELNRIHGPIGLKIAARSPQEIAVSILAEITAVLRGAA